MKAVERTSLRSKICFIFFFFFLIINLVLRITFLISGKWHRVTNVTEVCFGAKNDEKGTFFIDREGFVAAFKLVHVTGKVTCESDTCHSKTSYETNWGCSTSHPYVGSTPLGTFITTPSKRVLFPREKFIRDKSKTMWYALPGFEPNSPFLVFHDFANPEYFRDGQELQLWYGEDMKNSSESDNGGQTCAKVYVWYL